MNFDYAYSGSSSVESSGNATSMSFAPDVKREPTFFRAELAKPIAFREAISALHDVVVSDLRFKPKEKTAYKAWAAERDLVDWDAVAGRRADVAARIKVLSDEFADLTRRSYNRSKPYWDAQQRYFQYLYQKERDAWFVLDPVITVHPDEVFFECFSQDEASYGRLSVGYDVFRNLDEVSYGTTNIDYSAALYDEFQKIRSYKTTQFEIDPSGFNVRTTGEESFKEVKIDLPESWVRGFLQVSSAMSLPAVRFDLHPMDVHNICFVLRRHKEKTGPRGLRYELTPGAPVRIVLEPWGTVIECPRSLYTGPTAQEIRVWGRRRLHILERLIPVANRFTVHLLGTGMPSFYVADLGEMYFTLGLSGWTANDWSNAGNFDLLAPRADVDDYTKQMVFASLKRSWFREPGQIAEQLNLDRAVVLGALGAYTQAGRAIYDLARNVYRARELSREPLPMQKLRFSNEREEAATEFIVKKAVSVSVTAHDASGARTISGTVKTKDRTFSPTLTIDGDERIIRADCTCNWHQQNKLFKGPCEHILAARMQHSRQVRVL
jgi:hypothetical protein